MNTSRVVQTVVIFLGLTVLLGLGGVIWLVDHNVDPGSLALVSGLTGTALGSLGTLLASTKSGTDPAIAAVAEQAQAVGAAQVKVDLQELAADL